jgi:hypothetical protein
MISLLETTNLWFTFKTQFHLIMNYNLSVTDPPPKSGENPLASELARRFSIPHQDRNHHRDRRRTGRMRIKPPRKPPPHRRC